MAWDHHRLLQGPFRGLKTDDNLLATEDSSSRVHNLRLTPEGTMRTVVGPCEYRPREYADNGGTVPTVYHYYTPFNGIFHALLAEGKRDVLLAHFDGGVHVLNGWDKEFETLIGAPILGGGSDVLASLNEDAEYGFLTQFVATPNGVVIVPQGERSYFYDGEVCAPLGFDKPPGPPTLTGPQSWFELDVTTGERNDVANAGGYSHTGLDMTDYFGYSRLGTTRNDVIDTTAGKKSNSLGGVLQESEWRGFTQLKDRWGNLSPMSEPSAPVAMMKQDNLTKDRKRDNDETYKALKGQLLWSGIDPGPDHTFERDLYRSRDMKSTGDPAAYWVPPSATAVSSTTSTLPDTVTTVYPDNVPDSWLLVKGKDYAPMPRFRVACLAFGRMWMGNLEGDAGALMFSDIGFWGTAEKGRIHPDPRGCEITGLHAVAGGLLVFTRDSTFLIQQMGELTGATGFVAATLHPSIGCESPNTIQTLPSGVTVWLGAEGWYGWVSPEEPPRLVSTPIRHSVVRRINYARTKRAVAAVDPDTGEYRCWVPVDGSETNNLCVVFDGVGWRTRDDVNAHAVCVTRDHRRYMLALGTADGNRGLWCLDHEYDSVYSPGESEAVFESAWLRSNRAHRRSSIPRLTFFLRETTNTKVTVEVMRDWREHPTMPIQATAPDLTAADDLPPVWDEAEYDSTRKDTLRDEGDYIPEFFTRRRPYNVKYDVHLPACEVFKVRLKVTGDFEFISFRYEEEVQHKGNANMPGGQ